MRKYINYFIVTCLISSCTSSTSPEEENTIVIESTTSSSTTMQTTSTTTTTLKEVFAIDEFGIEMLEPTEEMKKQLDDLISFIEKRTELKFAQYPKFQLYTLEGYRDYSEASYLDDFEKDYEEGEWERAVLSENMWGLTTSSPDQMKKLIVEFQRCASAGSYNLLDETLRVPIKRNQKKFNFWEQSVIVHELVHSLQGQVVNLSNWYQVMKDSDDFMNYPGRRSIMEGQADLVQAYWESTLDSYDRQQMNSERPSFSCSVSLPSYFYIPFDLYYGYGGSLIKQVHRS